MSETTCFQSWSHGEHTCTSRRSTLAASKSLSLQPWKSTRLSRYSLYKEPVEVRCSNSFLEHSLIICYLIVQDATSTFRLCDIRLREAGSLSQFSLLLNFEEKLHLNKESWSMELLLWETWKCPLISSLSVSPILLSANNISTASTRERSSIILSSAFIT